MAAWVSSASGSILRSRRLTALCASVSDASSSAMAWCKLRLVQQSVQPWAADASRLTRSSSGSDPSRSARLPKVLRTSVSSEVVVTISGGSESGGFLKTAGLSGR